MNDTWKIWDDRDEYGKSFYLRSIGEKSEMESSKATAKIVKSLIQDNNKVLDIGCGGGHYLVSLDKTIDKKFSYHGIDATQSYIELAKKAFRDSSTEYRKEAIFEEGDIFNLPVPDGFADIVMCNNVLLHLPKIEKPVSELWRASKKYLIIRALIGEVSLRVKFVEEPEEFDENGDPINYYFHNIYSKSYIEKIIQSLNGVKQYKIFSDLDFDENNLGLENFEDLEYSDHENKFVTESLSGMQVASYLIQPWSYVVIERE